MVDAAGDMSHSLALRNRSLRGHDRTANPGFDDVQVHGRPSRCSRVRDDCRAVEQFESRVAAPRSGSAPRLLATALVAEESRSRLAAASSGGPSRDRTGDLRHAMAALSQLSYGPKVLRQFSRQVVVLGPSDAFCLVVLRRRQPELYGVSNIYL